MGSYLVTLTFYGGVGEIGGNKVLLEDEDTKIFLDFGMSFTRSAELFSEFLQPRKCNCIEDFLFTGLLPELEGVYRQDYLNYLGRPEEECGVDAVLLSHAHMDHAAYIHHLRLEVPIYMSAESRAILKTLEETGAGGFNEFLHYKTSFEYRPKKSGEGYTKVRGEEAKIPRRIEVFSSEKRFSVGPIEIVPFEVDHSLPGATAYLIHTSEGNVLYTGDFRFHGYRRERTERMVEAVSGEGVEAVITEGTRVSKERPEGNTEEDVLEKAGKIVSSTSGLAVINFPQRDLARLKTFYRIAQNSGRKLVLSFKHAYLLDQFRKLGKEYPSIDDPDLCFFADRKGWGVVGRSDFPENLVEQDYGKWERDYLDLPNTLNYRDVRANQDEYMFYCTFYQLNELIDIRPGAGSSYIRSVCEPFNEEMLLNERRVENWLRLYDLEPAYQVHASGHALGSEIFSTLEKLNPKQIYPIHTENADIFKSHFDQVRQIKEGVTYNL